MRDELAERLRAARVQIARRADEHEANRLRLERMLLDPGRHRFVRIDRQRPRRARLRGLGGPAAAGPDRHADGLVAGQALIRLSVSQGPRPLDRGPEAPMTDCRMRQLLKTGAGALLVVAIMFIGSLVLWIGTPLLWLWIGSQIQGQTASLGAALGVMFVGVIVTITAARLGAGQALERLPRQLPVPRPGRSRAISCSRGCSSSAPGVTLAVVRGLVLLLRRHQPDPGRDPALTLRRPRERRRV